MRCKYDLDMVDACSRIGKTIFKTKWCVCVCVFYYVGGSGEITFLFHVGLLTMRFKIGTSSYIYIY
jgi:hypothetical protein